jgi:hypothetical protein
MTWEIFLGIAAVVPFVAVFMKVARDLTSSVTKLTCSIDSLNKRFDDSQAVTTKRLDAHGEQIDNHETRIVKNEDEIKHIKEKVKYFHDV